jgi:uncharacterized paraquat-inducible protein A
MLGLRYLACPDCDTVYAVPEEPGASGACDRCAGSELEPLRSDADAAVYFAAALRRDAES